MPDNHLNLEKKSDPSKLESINNENNRDLKNKKNQKGLFWLISIGNNGSQLILLNFFQYFAVAVGVKEGILGFITAIRNLLGALLQGNFGYLSDKKGRKILLLIGFFLTFVATTLLIFSYNPLMLIIVSILHAFSFSIVVPVWNAALGDVTQKEGRTTFMGKLSSVGQGVGVILMMILAGIFWILDYFKDISLKYQVQYGIVFAICAANLLICTIGAAFLRETKKFEINKKPPKIFSAFKNKPFRNFIIVNSFFGFSMAALWPIYPIIQAGEEFLHMDIYKLILVAVIYTVTFSISNYFAGRIGDKFGRKPVLIFSRVIMFSVSLLYIPAVLSGSWYWIILTNSISGIGNGAFLIMMNAYALDMSPEEDQGSYSGLNQASWGIATFLGSLIMGFIAQALTENFNPLTMVLSTTIAIAIMRIFASVGYFFIKESLVINHEQNSKVKMTY
ncbi:MAG: MFS transporter [Candidatus Heimdallarchaeota archaeon]|nr:MFS transporter [Candidatus Heimdallarchaeota archaeon]